MDINTIKLKWTSKTINEPACIKLWDNRANYFSSLSENIPNAKNNLTMKIITKNNMINANQSVLDVGCGGGRFSFALEKLGTKVSGIDISPRMIEFAKSKASELNILASFYVGNWSSLSLEEYKWKNKFDLVLANMTPAICSAETFLKLTEASKNWCLMVKPTRRTNSILDVLNHMLKIPKDNFSTDLDIAYAFDLLWLNGMCPKLEYENQVWNNSLTLEEAIITYTDRIETHSILTESEKEQIVKYLNSIQQDGYIHETTHTTIVAMYWQVNN